jgi:hypothetical protein
MKKTVGILQHYLKNASSPLKMPKVSTVALNLEMEQEGLAEPNRINLQNSKIASSYIQWQTFSQADFTVPTTRLILLWLANMCG